jgi:hypothetical protein
MSKHQQGGFIMAASPKQIHYLVNSPILQHPSSVPSPPRASIRIPSPLDWKSPELSPRSVNFTSPPAPSGVSLNLPRCAEKGCVFPANSTTSGLCAYHDREQQEPALFRSQQPSQLLLDRAKFGMEVSEEATTRSQDRRRMARLREDFLDGGTT